MKPLTINGKNRIIILSSCMLILLISQVLALSIGISPGRVQFNSVLKGGYAERQVSISTNVEETLTGHFEPNGEIENWLTFNPNGTDMTLSNGNPYRLTIRVEPPEDTPTGNYTGFIEFITDGVADIEGRAGGMVKAAVILIINVEVTGDQRIECRAGGFSILDAEQGFPLELRLSVINDGNVRLNPTISVDVWDQLQEKQILNTEFSSDLVLPTTQRNLFEQISHSLSVGQYWATVRAEECNVEQLLTFNIVEKGAIADVGVLHSLINKPWITLGETVEVLANFQNSGGRSVDAQFKGTIRKEDTIVKIIETEELIVPSGEIVDFPILFTPYEEGRYVLSGRVVYNKKLTFEKSTVINVLSPDDASKSENWLALLLYLILIITILYLLRKIAKKRKEKQEHRL
jgi:hypothetical protein